MKQLAAKLRPYYFQILLVALAILAGIFLFGNSIKFVLVVSLLIITASLSTFYQNYIRSPVNFELIKFATVITAATYGLVTGLAVAMITTIASKIISEKLDHTAIVSLVGIIIVALGASMLGMEIAALGIILTIAYHLITAPIQMAMGGTLAYGMVYVGTNILFNVILFSRVAPFLIRLIA